MTPGWAHEFTRHSPDRVTEQLDSLYAEDLKPDEFVVEASRRALERSEW